MIALAKLFNRDGLGEVHAVRLAFYDRDGFDEVWPTAIVPAFAEQSRHTVTGCDASVYRDGSYRPSACRRIFAIGYNEAACAFNSVRDLAEANKFRGFGHSIYWVEDAVGSVSTYFAGQWTQERRQQLEQLGVRFIKTVDVPRLAVGNP